MTYRIECRVCGAGVTDNGLIRAVRVWLLFTRQLRWCRLGKYRGYTIRKVR